MLAAYNVAREELLKDPQLPFSGERIREYNRLILNGLKLEKEVVPGEIRTHSVTVGPYRAAPAEDRLRLVLDLSRSVHSSGEPVTSGRFQRSLPAWRVPLRSRRRRP